MVKRVVIEVHHNTAFCTELGVAATAATPEDAVRVLADRIRQSATEPVAISLPYLGETFSVGWENIKPPKPPEDEFELAQKLAENRKEEVVSVSYTHLRAHETPE